MNSFEIGILGLLFFLFVYALIDRICRCVEQVSVIRNVDLPENETIIQRVQEGFHEGKNNSVN